MELNWNDMGISWLTETVAKRDGNTKVELRGTAFIPQVIDLDKAVAHFGNEVIAGSLNGTSWRVLAQDVNRRMIVAKASEEAIKLAVYNRLRGIRNAVVGGTRTVTVTVYTLPDGTSYNGTDLVEYQQAFVAALVDMGVPPEAAITKSQGLKL